jgi:hypothetical protein
VGFSEARLPSYLLYRIRISIELSIKFFIFMHRYRDNKGRFLSSKDSKTNPPTNSTDIGAGKIPPGGSSRGASEAPEEEPRIEESTLGKIERESAEGTGHLEDTENPVSKPSISGGGESTEMAKE